MTRKLTRFHTFWGNVSLSVFFHRMDADANQLGTAANGGPAAGCGAANGAAGNGAAIVGIRND